MLGSIRARLLVFSAIPALLFLIIGVLVVLSLARGIQREEFIETLEVELFQLVAWAQVVDDGTFDPQLPGATRFETAFSGWYYQVFQLNETGGIDVVATSQSLQQARLNIPEIPEGSNRWFTEAIGPTGEGLMIVVQRVRAATLADNRPIPNPDDQFFIAVARSVEPLTQTNQLLYRALGIGFGIGAVYLMLSTIFLVTFSLAPLARAQQSLHGIRSGEASRLTGAFPREIEPLAEEINLLIDENEKVVERARTQVGNLAHALKTPLSVLTNEAQTAETPLANAVAEQAALMRAQVDRYLARARVAATSQVLGARTEVAPVISRLVRALEKIQADKNITVEQDVGEGLYLRGEQQDLEEVIGNVLENAFKWAKSRIVLKAEKTGADLLFTVADDGPGLAPEDRPQALKRGQRLDETTPGTGLGLSIVADIVSAYGGEVKLGAAALGGLEVKISLPSAR